MVGERGNGRTTLLLCAAVRLATQGERTAIVDLDGDLDPSSFSVVGLPAGWVWVICPERSKDALWAADLLIRSGHFGLVVLDGLSTFVPVSSLMRLQHGARESDVALLIGTSKGEVSSPGSLKIQVYAQGVEWEDGLGSPAEFQAVRLAARVAKRAGETAIRFACRPWRVLSRHSGVPDRRRARWTEMGKVR